MSIFADISTLSGSAFFKPADHMHAVALLVEPKRIDKNVRSSYQGKERVRDEAVATITVFKTNEAVDTGQPTEVLSDVKVSQTMLVSTIERLLDTGQITLGVIRKVPTQNGSGYAFRPVESQDIAKKVVAYYEAREAALTAATESAPSFE